MLAEQLNGVVVLSEYVKLSENSVLSSGKSSLLKLGGGFRSKQVKISS